MPRTRRRSPPSSRPRRSSCSRRALGPLYVVAGELGIHPNQLRTWRNERLAAGSAFRLQGSSRSSSWVSDGSRDPALSPIPSH